MFLPTQWFHTLNKQWKYCCPAIPSAYTFLACCHSARSSLFLTTLQKVKCCHSVPDNIPMKGHTTTPFFVSCWTWKILPLKTIIACLWKKHGDLHLLADKPWRSYAGSWLILLDIRHCVCLNCTTYWSHHVPTVSSCYPSGSVVMPLHACVLNSEAKWHCNR